MKVKLSLSLVLVALVIVSCKRLDKLVSFNLDTNDQVVWIPVPDSILTDTIIGNEDVFFVSDEFSFNDYPKFEQNKSTSSTVEDVQSLSLTIQLDSGATNFFFLRDLTVYLMSPNNLYKDLKLITVDVPDPVEDVITLDMEPSNAEFLTAIQKDKYQFRAEFTLDSPMPDTVYMSYKMGFRLKAQPTDD